MAEVQEQDAGQEEQDEAGFVRGVRFDDFKGLRAKAHSADKALKDLAAAQNEIAVLKTGLSLSPKQVKALFAAHEGEITSEALKATAVDLGFAEAEEEEEPAEERATRETAQQVQRTVAGATPHGKGATLTAADLEGWTQEKQMRFRAQHPEHWQTFLRDSEAKVPNPGGLW